MSRKIIYAFIENIETYDITPYLLPKSNVTFRPKGVHLWKDMLYGNCKNLIEKRSTYKLKKVKR